MGMVSLMTFEHWKRAWLFIPLLLLLALPCSAEAGKFKVGDVVQVWDDFGKEWNNGTVTGVNRRGELQVETARHGSLRREVYNPRAVRFAYEDGAIGPARNWTDATGSFKVMAAPLGVYGDTLKIRKEDMTELEVPISKLSESDQSYIERMRRELGGAAAPTPENLPMENYGDVEGARFALALQANGGRIALLPDPIPPYLQLKEGGTAFGRIGDGFDGEEFGVIIPVGGPESLVLASGECHPRWSHSKVDPFTRLLWVSIADRKIINQQKLPPDEYVLDYHPPSHRLLTYSFVDGGNANNDKKIALAIWEVLPTDEIVKPVARWEAYPDERSWDNPWAKIIDGQIVLQRWNKSEYVAWNVDEKSIAYRLRQESRSDSLPSFSGGKRYAFLPDQSSIRVFDPTTGVMLTSLPAPNGAKAVAISEDGKRAAVLDRNQLAVWDLTDANSEPTYYHADDIGRAWVDSMFWLGTDKLMVKTNREMLLFSIPQRVVVWSYQFEHTTKHGNGERPLVHVVNDHLVYGASVRDNNRNEGLAVGNVKLPGPKVAEVFGAIDREDLEVIKPGEHVRLEVRCGDDLNRDVYFSLVEKIEKNNWILDNENPTVTMYADMKRGKTQSATYEIVDHFNRSQGTESVTYTPNEYSLKIVRGSDVLWSSFMGGGLPDRFTIFGDASIQEIVNKWEVPSVSFFSRADIPARVIHKDYRRGLGTTQITTRGLIPGELKPPPEPAGGADGNKSKTEESDDDAPWSKPETSSDDAPWSTPGKSTGSAP